MSTPRSKNKMPKLLYVDPNPVSDDASVDGESFSGFADPASLAVPNDRVRAYVYALRDAVDISMEVTANITR